MKIRNRLRRMRITMLGVFAALLLSGNALAQQASLNGSVINIPVVAVGEQAFQLELTLVADSNPLQLLVTNSVVLTDFSTEGASTFDGTTLAVPSLNVNGVAYWANFNVFSTEPPVLVFLDAGAVAAQVSASCTRPDPDPSHGPNDPEIIAGFSVPPRDIAEGGPGADGIPAIDSPIFTQDLGSQPLRATELVVGIKIGDDMRAYPHTILDWHEIVNDQFLIDGQQGPVSLSYCPLTGSAMLWKGDMAAADSTFGTSGKLYNSNLVMYDRESLSLWSQMLEQGINSSKRLTVPDRLQVIETTWGTWQAMYPQTTVLTRETGATRPYGLYPYGSFRTDSSLLFEVNNSSDTRLHRKERVVGINVGASSKVYPISSFSAPITVINDTVGVMDVVATGSSALNFGVIFNRQLEDCTVLDFSAVHDQLPVVMTDGEGNQWDVFGTAVSGPRAGTQLEKTNSYTAYWFSWTAFFPNADIYQ